MKSITEHWLRHVRQEQFEHWQDAIPECLLAAWWARGRDDLTRATLSFFGRGRARALATWAWLDGDRERRTRSVAKALEAAGQISMCASLGQQSFAARRALERSAVRPVVARIPLEDERVVEAAHQLGLQFDPDKPSLAAIRSERYVCPSPQELMGADYLAQAWACTRLSSVESTDFLEKTWRSGLDSEVCFLVTSACDAWGLVPESAVSAGPIVKMARLRGLHRLADRFDHDSASETRAWSVICANSPDPEWCEQVRSARSGVAGSDQAFPPKKLFAGCAVACAEGKLDDWGNARLRHAHEAATGWILGLREMRPVPEAPSAHTVATLSVMVDEALEGKHPWSVLWRLARLGSEGHDTLVHDQVVRLEQRYNLLNEGSVLAFSVMSHVRGRSLELFETGGLSVELVLGLARDGHRALALECAERLLADEYTVLLADELHALAPLILAADDSAAAALAQAAQPFPTSAAAVMLFAALKGALD